MNEAPEPIRVVVVDDHEVVREGLRMMLEVAGKGAFALVGEAAEGVAALRIIEETRPAVVLMDLRMPGMDGREAITQIRARWPQVAVVILTTYNEDDLMLGGLRAGASGYLLKESDRATIFAALRAAARGESLLPADILARLLAHTTASVPGSGPRQQETSPASGRPAREELTQRERDVLAAVARGERSKEIARRLGIAPRTVATHLTSIFGKLGVDSRAAAVAVALKRGLLPGED